MKSTTSTGGGTPRPLEGQGRPRGKHPAGPPTSGTILHIENGKPHSGAPNCPRKRLAPASADSARDGPRRRPSRSCEPGHRRVSRCEHGEPLARSWIDQGVVTVVDL